MKTPGTAVDVVDLVRRFGEAEKRPSPSTFDVAEYTAAGVGRPSIVATAPSRLTWTLTMPVGGSFHAQVHAIAAESRDVGLRVGVADNRVYEILAHVWLSSSNPGWTPIAVDLSRYAGRKWSLFYRPDAHRWRLVLSVDAADRPDVRAIWGSPAIATDTAHARAFIAGHR